MAPSATGKRMRVWLCLLGAAALGAFSACSSSSDSDPAASASGSGGGPGGKADNPNDPDSPIRDVKFLYTSDEHGWLTPYQRSGSSVVRGGLGHVYATWLTAESYTPETHFLLSGGDNWSGASTTTWFKGKPMVEAFNLLGYRGAAIGNHEFDFGPEAMRERFAEAQYPYLSANMVSKTTGELVDFAQPYFIAALNRVPVGVVGLTATSTATDAHPKLTADIEFVDYAETLERYVPQMRSEGAKVVAVVAHECCGALEGLAETLSVDVDVMFGAHCHKRSSKVVNDVPVVCAGWGYQYYGRVRLRYNLDTSEVEETEASVGEVKYRTDDEVPAEPDPAVQSFVDAWEQKANEELGGPVGYTEQGVEKGSWEMGNWVTDSWLWAFPEADVAVEIFGGLRQQIPQGEITLGDVVGMLPFDNEVYQIEITGAQLAENLAYAAETCFFRTACYPAVAGIRYELVDGQITIRFADGRIFEPDAVYRVLVNDFVYWGGVGFFFNDYDSTPIETGVKTRQPVIDWTLERGTTPEDPLENYLDDTGRDYLGSN